ncbi:MAG TPA: thiamine diphosphokinase [Candidatus Erysipelatoclostridium merdavium]|uniref:Thiamine diphosphokinase n=1 Tax=Candidatus Erysipelatoclostridium merdavium TaxID=2838566 RepID=A0A9D1XMU4_9FIRM|nr:thiamine diphosphokinase [Candidatus Erysipelatoclostridium merdavium]
MKIGICSALANNIDLSIDYIGVDRGVEVLLAHNKTPIYAIGDFDSINNPDVLNKIEVTRLPTRKDVTDTHAAVEYAIEQGYDEIDIYGVTGGRLDHFFSAVCLLEKYANLKIRIIDDQNIIQLLLPGRHLVNKDQYKYFSLFALDKSYLDITGAHYPLNHYLLYRYDPLCVSNQVKDDQAVITTTDKIILVKSNDIKLF